MIVNLDKDDLIYIANVAHKRRQNKATGPVASQKYSSKTEFQCDYDGAMTEYSVYKEMGISTQRMEELCFGADDGVDIVINDWPCHIKKSVHMDCPVNQPFEKNFTAMIGIFVRIICQTQVEILGCIGRTRFKEEAKIKNWGHGDRLVIHASQLIPVSELLSQPPRKKSA